MCFSGPSIQSPAQPIAAPAPVLPPDPITDERVPILATPKQAKTVAEQKTSNSSSRTSSKKKTGKSSLRIELGGLNTTGSGLTIPKA